MKSHKSFLSFLIFCAILPFFFIFSIFAQNPALESEMLQNFRKSGGPMEDIHEILFAVKRPSEDPHWYANFGYYSGDKDTFPFPLGEGGMLRILNLDTGEARTIFEDQKGNIRNPRVHYDGKKAIFSYLPAGKRHFNLYEINLDGTGLRQITHGDWDDLEPAYLPRRRSSLAG